MTREQETNQEVARYLFEDFKPTGVITEERFAVGVYMAKWADEHPKNPWRDASKELPPIDQTQHTTKKNMSVAVLCWDANIHCDSLGQVYSPSICKYDYERKDWLHVELGYYENELEIGLQITHWMLIPETPKGGER